MGLLLCLELYCLEMVKGAKEEKMMLGMERRVRMVVGMGCVLMVIRL